MLIEALKYGAVCYLIEWLYCIVLYCAVLYCIVVYCIALHCINFWTQINVYRLT